MAGHMVFGPYATDFPAGRTTVIFELTEDVVDTLAETVVSLDVYDADTGEALAERDVGRHEFRAPFETQSFALDVDLSARSGHRIETRVYWHARALISVERIAVYGASSVP